MRIDHVAGTCCDPQETHRFYTEVLGLHLAQAYAGHELMLVYALPEGGSLVFSTTREPSPCRGADWERNHVGLTVSTRAELEKWLRRLQQLGIPHKLIENERIYFADPDGLVLELEVASPATINPSAGEVLARWQR